MQPPSPSPPAHTSGKAGYDLKTRGYVDEEARPREPPLLFTNL